MSSNGLRFGFRQCYEAINCYTLAGCIRQSQLDYKSPQFVKLEKLVLRPGIKPGSPAVIASALTTELPNSAR